MVTVRVSETYDLSTKVGKMGLVAIHTPTGDLIRRLWGGLVENHKYFKFTSCDVAMACASMLPADPLQIGNEAGSIAPQDMFNPILYKAVSNDAMSNLEMFMQAGQPTGVSALEKGSIKDYNDVDFKGSDDVSLSQFDMYYSLLANPDGWRKAMPQAGLEMTGLYPIVFQMISNYGLFNPTQSNGPVYRAPGAKDGAQGEVMEVNTMMRGPAMRMPALPTTIYIAGDTNPFMDGAVIQDDNTGTVPPCYVAAIVLPPAKLNQLYYRLKVTWTIEFSGIRPKSDLMSWQNLRDIGLVCYGTDYATQSLAMTAKESMVDTKDTTLEKIMEGA